MPGRAKLLGPIDYSMTPLRGYSSKPRAPPSPPIVDPHHQYPVGRQPGEELGKQDRQPERSGVAARPDNHAEVVRPPQDPHDEPCTKDIVTLAQPGHGEPRPAQLLQEASA